MEIRRSEIMNLTENGKLKRKQIRVNNGMNNVFCNLEQDTEYDYVTVFVEDTKITNKFFSELKSLMEENDYIFRDLKKHNTFVYRLIYDCFKYPEQYSKCSCGKVVETSKFEEHVKMFEGEHKLMENDKEVRR